MKKNEKLLYFMGQIRTNIESLVELAGKNSPDSKLLAELVDFEQFFNQTIDEVFATIEEPEHDRPFTGRIGLMLWT